MNEISFDFLLKILKKSWWKILIVTLVAMVLVASLTHFVIPKKYSSSIEFYVVNLNSELDYTTTSYLNAATQLINDYVAIIKSDYMLDQICEVLRQDGYPNITSASIRQSGMISSSTASTQISVFTLSVKHTDKVLAYKVAAAIADLAPAAVTKIAKPESSENTNLNCLEVLTKPVEDTVHDFPNLMLFTLLGGVLAAAATYVYFLVCHFFEQSITTEEDVKKMLNRPIIGVIPRWESTSAKK